MPAANGNRRRVVIITGTPGVGKHSVARAVAGASASEWIVVDAGDVARRAGLFSGNYQAGRDTTDIDTDALSREIGREIRHGGDHIIVGHLAPYATPGDGVVLAVVLRRDPRELMGVYAERGYREAKARENAGAEVLGVIEHDTFAASYARTTQLDTTGRGPEEVAGIILDVLSAVHPGSGYCGALGAIPEEHDHPEGSFDWTRTARTRRAGGRGDGGNEEEAAEQSRMLGEFMPDWPRTSHPAEADD